MSGNNINGLYLLMLGIEEIASDKAGPIEVERNISHECIISIFNTHVKEFK